MAAKALFVSGVVLAALFRCGWLEAADLLVKLRVQTNVPPTFQEGRYESH